MSKYTSNYNQKRSLLDEDEKIIREENLEARQHITRKGVHALKSAICLQAVADYKSAMKGKAISRCGGGKPVPPEETIQECEAFFREEDGLMQQVTGIHDPDRLIKLVRQIPAGYEDTLQKKKR